MSPNDVTTEDSNEDDGDWEFQKTSSNESPPSATQSDNEAQLAPTTEKTQPKLSTKRKMKQMLFQYWQLQIISLLKRVEELRALLASRTEMESAGNSEASSFRRHRELSSPSRNL